MKPRIVFLVLIAFVFVLVSGEGVSAVQEPNGWWNTTLDMTLAGSYNLTNEFNTTSANITINSGTVLIINNSYLNFTLGRINNNNGASLINIYNSYLKGSNAGTLNNLRFSGSVNHPNVTIINTIITNFDLISFNNAKSWIYINNISVSNTTSENIFSAGSNNIIINNSYFSNSSSSQECIQLSNNTNVTIENSYFYNCASQGIFGNNGGKDIVLRNLTILNPKTLQAMSFNSYNNTHVYNSYVANSLSYGYDFLGYGNNHLVQESIANNTLYGVAFSFGDGGIGNSSNVTSNSNKVYNIGLNGIEFNTVDGGFSFNDYVENAYQRGLSISTNNRNIKVNNMTIINTTLDSVLISNSVNNVTISNLSVFYANRTFYIDNASNISIIDSLSQSSNYYGRINTRLVTDLNISNVSSYYWFTSSAISMDFNLSEDFEYFKSISTVKNNISLYNLDNALVFYDNDSIVGNPTVSSNDGSLNISLPPNNHSFIMENYQVDETTTRANDPISITGSSTSKTITSNLVDSITADVVAQFPNCDGSRFNYNGQIISSGFTCSGDGVFTFSQLQVNSGENTLEQTQVCVYGETIGYTIIMIFTSLGILAICFLLLNGNLDIKNPSFDRMNMKTLLLVFFLIIIGVAFISAMGNTIAARCTI